MYTTTDDSNNIKIPPSFTLTMALWINEIFYSIQGEGILTGYPTIFIRTSGCNLRCNWCDTTYAHDQGTEMEVQEILDKIHDLRERNGCTRICITGGEPLIQEELKDLTLGLLAKGNQVSIETNGSLIIDELFQYLSGETDLKNLMISLDMKCPSSGVQHAMNTGNIIFLGPNDQLKFIVSDLEDLEHAFTIIENYNPACPIIIQPATIVDDDAENTPFLPSSDIQLLVQEFLRKAHSCDTIRFMIQQHKIIWGNKKGV